MQRGCGWDGLELPVLSSQRFLKGAAPWSAGYGLEEEQWELCWTVGGAAGGLSIWALVTWPQACPVVWELG